MRITQKTLAEARDSQLIREVGHMRTEAWAEKYRARMNPKHKIDLNHLRELEKNLAAIELELTTRYPNN
tara:strand:- start:41 stop:247 length:207 start_codon:yes stop_codon:yes gene_type:complete